MAAASPRSTPPSPPASPLLQIHLPGKGRPPRNINWTLHNKIQWDQAFKLTVFIFNLWEFLAIYLIIFILFPPPSPLNLISFTLFKNKTQNKIKSWNIEPSLTWITTEHRTCPRVWLVDPVETYFASPSSYQLTIAPWLRVGLHAPLILSCLDFVWLTCAGLMHAVPVSVSSYVHPHWLSGNCLFWHHLPKKLLLVVSND